MCISVIDSVDVAIGGYSELRSKTLNRRMFGSHVRNRAKRIMKDIYRTPYPSYEESEGRALPLSLATGRGLTFGIAVTSTSGLDSAACGAETPQTWLEQSVQIT
eukprot:9495586-Pyramimonas_sp.AAC.2